MANILKTLGNSLATLAPSAAAMLGGPLAGMAVTQVESWLGIAPAPGTSLDERAAAIQSGLATISPEQVVAMKQADDALKQKMVDAGVQLAQLDQQDRASARFMQVSTKSYLTPMLAVLVVGGFVMMTGLKFSGMVVTTDATTSDLLTTLRDALMLVLSFYFGSAASVDRQHALIDKALDNAASKP